jgi:hypothetical protein
MSFDFLKNRVPVTLTFAKNIALPAGLGIYDLLDKLRAATHEKMSASSDDWVSLHEVYDDKLICCRYGYGDGDSGHFMMTWSVDTEGNVVLGDATEVEPVTSYIPVAKRYSEKAVSDFVGVV